MKLDMRRSDSRSTNRKSAIAWLSLAILVIVAVWPVPASASGKDAVLYELNEEAQLTDTFHRVAKSGLEGKADGLVDYAEGFFAGFGITVKDASRCTVVVFGESDINLTTVPPSGTIGGNFFVVVNSDLTNFTDAPELAVMAGTFEGNVLVTDPDGLIIDVLTGATLTPTFVLPGFPDGLPGSSTFTGKFRLPFKFHHKAVYKKDNGNVVPVKPDERALGDPTVRLELNFGHHHDDDD